MSWRAISSASAVSASSASASERSVAGVGVSGIVEALLPFPRSGRGGPRPAERVVERESGAHELPGSDSLLRAQDNCVGNSGKVSVYFARADAQHCDAPASEPSVTCSVLGSFVLSPMRRAVHLDREPCGRTIEVEDHRLVWELPPKYRLRRAALLQPRPQHDF